MKILKQISIHLLLLSLIVVPVLVGAQAKTGAIQFPEKTTKVPFKIDNPFNCGNPAGSPNNCTIMTLIVAILNNVIMPVAAVGVVLFIVYAGFLFVMAQGNPGEVTKAKNTLLWGLIGAGVLLGAAGISKVVENTVSRLIVP